MQNRLQVGKLYRVRENPLSVYNTEYYTIHAIGRANHYIDTCQPFLILNVGENHRTYEVLFNDCKGWVWLDLDNVVEEVK